MAGHAQLSKMSLDEARLHLIRALHTTGEDGRCTQDGYTAPCPTVQYTHLRFPLPGENEEEEREG